MMKAAIERKLAKIPPSYVEYLPRVQQFTDITRLLQGGYHMLVIGITGSGKSTLLLTLLRNFVERGFTVLARDDGGLEATYLLPFTPITYWVPEGCRLKIRNQDEARLNEYEVREYDWRNPGEILDHVFESPFNLVVFDAFCIDPGMSAVFWAELFKTLIFKCMQTPRSEKEKLIFSVDELNDLIQPKGYELTRKHSNVRALIEYNIRKLRKHNVTLIATSHRFTQLGISVRSQFSYIAVKKSFGWDAWDFLSKSLATQNNKVFWAILKDVTTMGPEYFYLFDYKNNFDKYVFRDIYRPKVDTVLEGVVMEEGVEEGANIWKARCLRILRYLYRKKMMTEAELAQLAAVSQPTISRWLRSAQPHELDSWGG